MKHILIALIAAVPLLAAGQTLREGRAAGTNALAPLRSTPLLRAATRPATAVSLLAAGETITPLTRTNVVSAGTNALPQIRLARGGAAVDAGAHGVRFAANLNTAGAIEVATADRQHLRSTPVGLAYFDAASGRSVLIAQVKDAVGGILSPNRVLYRDAFDGVSADVLYTVKRGSFEQDVVLREAPPEPSDFGLNPQTTHLLVLTEFFDTAVPVATARLHGAEVLQAPLARPTRELLTDQTLAFGRMRLVAGKAFSLGPQKGQVPVVKTWQTLEGRTFLVESALYRSARPLLKELPARIERTPATAWKPREALTLAALLPPPARAPQSATPMLLAQAQPAGTPGFVLDYVLMHYQVPYLANVDFGQGEESPKYGWAAVGKDEWDYWNFFSRDDGEGGYLEYGELWDLTLSSGFGSPIKLTVANAPGAWGNGHPDPMFQEYLYTYGDDITLTLTNLPAARYDFYLYSHGPSADGNSRFGLDVGATNFGSLATATGWGWTNTTWIEGEQYVVFTNVPVGGTDLVTITVETDACDYAMLAGLQIASTPGIDPPALSLTANSDTTEFLLQLDHAQAEDYWSSVSSNALANPAAFPVTNSYADSWMARQTGCNRSVSAGVNITKLPAITISPNGGYYHYPTNVSLSLGLENLYRTELERQADAGGLDCWAACAEDLRSESWSDEEIRTFMVNDVFRGSWEYSVCQPVAADAYVFNDTLTLEYSTNNGASWATYSGPFALAANVTVQARATKSGMADNRTHYAFLTSAATAAFSHIPASWMQQYFGTNWQTNPNAAPSADPDGDGLTNLQEYLLGTNPMVAAVSDSTDEIQLRVHTPLK